MTSERTLQGALTFLGFAISILAIGYFAGSYIPDISPWSQLASLALLSLAFAYLGVFLKETTIGQPFFEGPRLRWLRPPVVLYLLALIGAIWAEIVFFGIDDMPRALKILISLILGIGLIVVVARRKGGAKEASPDSPARRV